MEDDSIYNAIIASLIIGIIVVIITLIVARPEPESFTELYINEHKLLPKYVEDNKEYPFSFTIANHENQNKLYNYSIATNLYSINYGCEASRLYFEEKESEIYKTFIKGNYETPTRKSETKDPALLIKNNKYEASFNYKTRAGAGQIVIIFKDQNNIEKYAIAVSEESNNAFFMEFKEDKIHVRKKSIELETRKQHNIRISADQGKIKLYIDKNYIFQQETGSPSGYLSFETTNTYADITGFTLTKDNTKLTPGISFSGMDYQTEIFTVKKDIGKDNYKLYKAYLEKQASTAKAVTKEYTSEETLNLSSYSVDSVFRITKGSTASVGIKGTFELIYNQDEKKAVLAWYTPQGMKVTSKRIKPSKNWQKVTVDINNNKAYIYLNYNLIREIDNIMDYEYKKPFMKTYNSEIILRQFNIKNNIEPFSINYKAKTPIEQNITYEDIPTTALIQLANSMLYNSSNLEQKEIFEGLFEKQKTTWKNYRVTSSYIDPQRNSSVSFYFGEIDKPFYNLKIDDKNNLISISYEKDKKPQNIEKQGLLMDTLAHKVSIDVSNNVSINIDGMNVFSEEVDKSTDGVLLLDYPENIIFAELQIENKDTDEIKVLRTKEIECKPIPLKEYTKTDTILIEDKEQEVINSSRTFKGDFDLAKIQVNLNEAQEIHFWVSKI